MRFALDQDPTEAPLKEVAPPPVPAIEALGVEAIELTHALRQVGLGGIDKEMVVVGHQTVGMAPPAVAVDHFAKHIEESARIGVVQKDRGAGVPARGHVVEGPRKLEAERPSHGRRLTSRVDSLGPQIPKMCQFKT
jgi:hypothetical protein